MEPNFTEISPKERNPLSIILIVIFIFILLVVLSIILWLQNQPPQLKIDNFQKYYQDVPKTEIDKIFASLYEKSTTNLYIENTKTPNSGALIRDNTATNEYNSNTDIHYGSFIVDIPATEQSYLASFEWSNNKNNQSLSTYIDGITFTCLRKDSSIYPNFNFNHCTDVNGVNDGIDYLVSDLPTFLNTESNFHFYITNHTYTSSDEIYLEVSANTCGNESIIKEILQTTKQFITNYYLDPETIPIELRNTCDGEA